MNAVLISVLVMLALSLMRVSVVFSLIIAALVGGLLAGLGLTDTIAIFSKGIGGGADIALSYATLGAFAVALSRTGLTTNLTNWVLSKVHNNASVTDKVVKNTLCGIVYLIIVILTIFGFLAETIIPVHIAFIPLVVPPLLIIFSKLSVDRRMIACVITFSITLLYMTAPVGFGNIFMVKILGGNLEKGGILVSTADIVQAMLIPGIGMVVGVLIAIFYSYKKPRAYKVLEISSTQEESVTISAFQKLIIAVALVATVGLQLYTDSIIFGGLIGFGILTLGGFFKWHEQDSVFLEGVRLMAVIGFIMISAQGFSAVIKETGQVSTLVASAIDIIGQSKPLAAIAMLIVGLVITMGIGSSFSTVPIIAVIFVPLATAIGFSPLATIALIGTAGALGDAGSPASDSTLAPTAGLNADGQHDHIKDTVIPTFIHFNIPLLVFGYIAAIVL